MSAASFQLVRFKKGKKHFEVMTEPGSVLLFRTGKLGWAQVLVTDTIFKNQSKGDRAKDEDLEAVFGTTDVEEVAKLIVEKGELQVSAAERKEELDKKRREVIAHLHRNYMDPKTNLPHPVVRIETALEGLKNFHINPDDSTKDQVGELIKKLHGVMAFKKAETEGILVVKHAHVGAVTGIVYKFSEVHREKSTPGGYQWEVGLAPGDFDNFTAALNKVTKGDYQFSMSGEAPKLEEESGKKGKRGKKGKSKKGKKRRG